MAVFYGNWNQTKWSTVFYFINCIRGDISPNLILCHANVELSAALAHCFKNCDSCCYCLCTCLNDKWCTLPCSAVNFLDEASLSSLFLCFIVLSRINSLEIHWFLRCNRTVFLYWLLQHSCHAIRFKLKKNGTWYCQVEI